MIIGDRTNYKIATIIVYVHVVSAILKLKTVLKVFLNDIRYNNYTSFSHIIGILPKTMCNFNSNKYECILRMGTIQCQLSLIISFLH